MNKKMRKNTKGGNMSNDITKEGITNTLKILNLAMKTITMMLIINE
jgi:hypothetical protein